MATQAQGQSKFLPTGLRVGIDVANPFYQAIADKNKQIIELHADVDFHDYFVTADFGRASILRNKNGNTFKTDGSFYRGGIDFNLLKNEPLVQAVFIGFRYGAANFNNSLSYTKTDTLFGGYSFSGSNSDISARWFEMTTGIKAHVWNQFYMGFTFRFKTGLKVKNEGSFKAYEVPGYGIRDRVQWSGVNYYIMYRIPFRKKVVPETKK